MQTILEAANEYAISNYGVDNVDDCLVAREGFIACANFIQHWIPVGEDLPPIDKNHRDDRDFGDGWFIVVLLNAGTHNTGRYNHIKKEWRKLDYSLVFNVISWRYITVI